MGSKKRSLAALAAEIVLIYVIFYLLDPIPQPLSYHHFADQMAWFGIWNVWNVLSNAAIALPGLWGMYLLSKPKKVKFNDPKERWPWIGFSIGLILTAIGSAFYHFAPDNSRLILDRMFMTVVFMSLTAALISERIDALLGLWLWPTLLCIGFSSVWMWYVNEIQGVSDLRFYIGIQCFTVAVALTVLIFPSPYDRKGYLALAILCYGLAVMFEIFDHQIYRFTGYIISGHTLKHLAVGLAGFLLIEMIRKRKKQV